jgi:hypothetical protein
MKLHAFDREGDYAAGYHDGVNGFPRESTRPYYRRGYDAGLSALIAKNHPAREENQS